MTRTLPDFPFTLPPKVHEWLNKQLSEASLFLQAAGFIIAMLCVGALVCGAMLFAFTVAALVDLYKWLFAPVDEAA